MMLEGLGGQSLREMAPSGGRWRGRALGPHLCELRSLGGGDVEAQVLGHPPQGLGGREHVGPVGPTAVLWTRVVSWALLEG